MHGLLITASFLVSLATAVPTLHRRQANGATNATAATGADSYTFFSGDGSAAAGWPAQSKWLDFETMFYNNKVVMSSSCSQFKVADNSDAEIQGIHNAITAVSATTGVDPRFMLAIVMQESKGCVRVPTTSLGVPYGAPKLIPSYIFN